jgi:hypothetical protein
MTLANDDPAVVSLQLIDDAIYVDDADWIGDSSKHMLVGGVYQSTPQTITDGDVGPISLNKHGSVRTEPALQVDHVFDADKKATIQRTTVIADTGTYEVIAAPTGTKKIRVLALKLHATSATVTNVYLRTTSDASILFNAANPLALAVDADADNVPEFTLDWNPGGWFETLTADEALNIVLSAAQDVVVCITWIEVD